MSEDFKYDVAFSLLTRDAPLAERLADPLAPLSTFVFTQRQREIVGRDGVEAFSEVFRRDARLAVILHREGWGESDYTDLEARGIRDRGMRARWATPLVIKLDDSELPAWIPENNIWLNLEKYGLEEAVGAIRLTASKLGAPERTEDAAAFGRRVAERARDDLERQSFQYSAAGFAQIEAEIESIFQQLEDTIAALDEERRVLPIEGARNLMAGRHGFVVRSPRIGTSLTWWVPYINSFENSRLRVTLSDGPVDQYGEPRQGGEQRRLDEVTYEPRFDADRVWRWHPEKPGSAFTSNDLADAVMKRHIAGVRGDRRDMRLRR